MTRLNHLLVLCIIFEVSFYCTPALAKSSTSEQNNKDFCHVTQCGIETSLAKNAIMKCLQNIENCTNKKINTGK